MKLIGEESPKEMPFFDHIEELRWRILRSLGAIILGAIVVALNSKWVVDTLLLAPLKSDFFTFNMFNKLSHLVGGSDLYSGDFNIKLQNLDISGQFSAFIWLSLVGGLIVSAPYLFFEMWGFLKPALKESERKMSGVFIFTAVVLFVLGVLFSYYFVVPLSVQFFYFFKLSDSIDNNFHLSSYVSMYIQSLLSMGLVFLMPLVMYFLTQMGVVTPKFLKEHRKHAFIVVLTIAAIITPSDMSSMVIASIPLWLLYEASVLVSVWVYKEPKAEVVPYKE
ncbi:MAG: twin-arginine translocase subunit TatC [Flavobacteriaceae bacterium]|nr:MAG: twin-arginine translocase subunit TatC [Flavobacteriaceae bacterium]